MGQERQEVFSALKRGLNLRVGTIKNHWLLGRE